jgi:DNA/RNA endonuclease YhcR with UshA esterase domain
MQWNSISSKRVSRKSLAFLLCLTSLCVITVASVPAQQQNSAQPSAIRSGSATKGATVSEITINGTIQQLRHTNAAVHLLVNSAQGAFDALVSSSLCAETLQSLSKDAPVQIAGTLHTINGKEYLLVRQLTIAGRTITIRNNTGFPVCAQSASQGDLKGSAQ